MYDQIKYLCATGCQFGDDQAATRGEDLPGEDTDPSQLINFEIKICQYDSMRPFGILILVGNFQKSVFYLAARLISVIFCNLVYCSFIRFSLRFLPTFSKRNIMF